MSQLYDVIIIGGGIIGSSIAFNLKNDGFDGKIAVFERDPTYEYSSTALSSAGIREQFSQEVNIKISMYALEILKNFEEEMQVDEDPPHIGLKNTGYMFVANTEKQMSILEKNNVTQKRLGASVELIGPDEILNKVPIMNIEGVTGASFGERDSDIDPWGFLQAYIKKGKSLGVKYIYDEVTEILTEENSVAGIKTKKGDKFLSGIIVNASGPWSGEVAKLAGITLPVVPLRRQMFFFNAPKKFDYMFPLIINGNGLVWRNETDEQFRVSKYKEGDPPGFNFTVDYDFFNEVLWPELAHIAPLFNSLKLTRAFSGLYCVNTIDANAIVGEHPELQGFYLATGFSGHGLQQAPAIGKGFSELIRLQRYETLDLGSLKPQRFEMNELVIEETFLHEDL